MTNERATGTVAVLGSANMDLVVRQERLPLPGETIAGRDFTTVPGGKGLNQAIAAARGGVSVAFIGAVGDDEFGRRLRDALAQDGIDTHRLVDVAVATGTAHISVLADGENAIVVVPGANAEIDELADRDRAVIGSARFLMAQLERPAALVRQALRFARASGVVTVLTPAPVSTDAIDLVDDADILVPNAEEARQLSGLADDVAAARALSTRAGLVVMTRGARGALIARAGDVVAEVAAHRVDPADTTAAGDTFAGMLVARLAAGDELDRALEVATAAASITVSRPGASCSIPTRSEVAALVDRDRIRDRD